MLARRRLILCLGLVAALPAARAAAAGKTDEDGEELGPYLELPTLTATAIRADGRRGVLTVQATLSIPDPDKRLKAARLMPRLKDAFVVALQGWAYQMVPGSLPNVELMSQGLQRATDRILGPGARVLLGGVMLT